MDNYLTYAASADQSVAYEDILEAMYPDSYAKVYPHVQDVVDTLSDEDIAVLTPGDITYLANQVVKQSTVGTAVKSQNALTDIAQILLVRELFDRFDGRRVAPYLIPLYLAGGSRSRRGRGRFGRY